MIKSALMWAGLFTVGIVAGLFISSVTFWLFFSRIIY